MEDAGMLPWQYSKKSGPFPWEGLHNKLPELLKVQAKDNTVFVMIFNESFAGLALNCIVSLVRYGRANNYIVGVVSQQSLQRCMQLRLPCYDASANATTITQAIDDSAKRNSLEWYHLVWAKTLVTNEVFRLGYDVGFADADTVFLKPALKVYSSYLDQYDADGTFMFEEKNTTDEKGNVALKQYLNSGNFFLKNNIRTQFVMDEWMRGYAEHKDENGNQLWLNWMPEMKIPSYKICHTKSQCAALKRQGLAAIKPHPNQYDGVGQYCTPDSIPDICSDRRLYIHAICKTGHLAKRHAFEQLGLWMIDIKVWPQDVKVSDPARNLLPCPGEEAWKATYH
jgi:hypothetical protein